MTEAEKDWGLLKASRDALRRIARALEMPESSLTEDVPAEVERRVGNGREMLESLEEALSAGSKLRAHRDDEREAEVASAQRLADRIVGGFVDRLRSEIKDRTRILKGVIEDEPETEEQLRDAVTEFGFLLEWIDNNAPAIPGPSPKEEKLFATQVEVDDLSGRVAQLETARRGPCEG